MHYQIRSKRHNYKYSRNNCPFCYRKASDDKSKLLIDEEAAAVVRKIFHLALDEMSMYQICQVLNNESVPTPAVYMNEKFGRRDAHMEKKRESILDCRQDRFLFDLRKEFI